ncbi:glycosyltransferase, partial [Kineococcus sp. T13]|uniref:glycosyltransferase family 4 protein n=1 Tax=Kineococcus vitellinus TaxID=2696565 RepID=UPI001411E0C0
PSVVCLGRLVPHKRTELVVEAFRTVLERHPDATLTVVGRGPEAARLHEAAAAAGLGGAVSFRDDLDDAARDETLASAWLTVNASQGEGWGLSVVEANALGVPALAFRRPGLRDSIVHGETGWLVDDDADLGDAVADALDELGDLGRARQLAQHARRWADRFTWDAMAQRVLDALSSEQQRLVLGEDDRRTSSDLSTVVTVPLQLLPPTWRTAIRETDVYEVSGESVTVLCRSADSQTVPKLLGRLGLPESAELGEGFSTSVARTSDLLRLALPRSERG